MNVKPGKKIRTKVRSWAHNFFILSWSVVSVVESNSCHIWIQSKCRWDYNPKITKLKVEKAVRNGDLLELNWKSDNNPKTWRPELNKLGVSTLSTAEISFGQILDAWNRTENIWSYRIRTRYFVNVKPACKLLN